MLHPCYVPGCRGNYESSRNVRIYSFPQDEELCRKWLLAIRRENFTVTKFSKGKYSKVRLCLFRTRQCNKNFFVVLITSLAIGLFLVVFRVYNPEQSNMNCYSISTLASVTVIKPIVQIYGSKPETGYLDHVMSVFEKIGYKIVIGNGSHWDVLWSHSYPFLVFAEEMAHLKQHQKVNHFPGSGFITQKANLAAIDVEQIPKAFRMPDDKTKFLKHVKENSEKRWIQKSNSHRGIRIQSVNEFNLDAEGTFIQEYISNPLLIDERKFDIGVYVILTSIDPLRVYIYSGDVLLRFCPENYYPFDPTRLESYVVSDDYLPIWKIESLKTFYSDLNYTAKESLNAYLHLQGKNVPKMWSQISQAVQDVYFETESLIKRTTHRYGFLRNFFELVRFDFVVDEELNVFLMEANMSPNLSSEHFPPNRLLYEQVLFNVLSVTGLAKSYQSSSRHREEMEISYKDIQVYPEDCSLPVCQNSCKTPKCKVCNNCMTEELKVIAKEAYQEHMNRKNCRRLIPIPLNTKNSNEPQTRKQREQSEMNSFMDRWFKGKCLQDVTWCQ